MKIEQVAIATQNPDALVETLKMFGLKDWARDVVTAEGHVFGQLARNTAILNFNYDLGFELEILKYIDGPNWHDVNGPADGSNFLSHLGLHVEESEMAEMKKKMEKLGCGIAQEVYTINHTNPVIAGKRKYHYVVFDSRRAIGFDLKLISRIYLEDPA